MRIFITGATGFIGRALVKRLRGASHEIVAWVRDAERARESVGDDLTFIATSESDDVLSAALDGCDALVNLAGRPVIGRRWTRAYRRDLVSSRVDLTRRLMAAIGPPVPPPITRMSVSMISVFVADSKALMARSRVNGVAAFVLSPRGRIGGSGCLRRGGRAVDGLSRQGA